MQQTAEKEKCVLKSLAKAEDLAEKKLKIFSRILTDAALAQDMEALAKKHEQRKTELLLLAGEKVKKAANDEGMSETNGEEEEE